MLIVEVEDLSSTKKSKTSLEHSGIKPRAGSMGDLLRKRVSEGDQVMKDEILEDISVDNLSGLESEGNISYMPKIGLP